LRPYRVAQSLAELALPARKKAGRTLGEATVASEYNTSNAPPQISTEGWCGKPCGLGVRRQP